MCVSFGLCLTKVLEQWLCVCVLFEGTLAGVGFLGYRRETTILRFPVMIVGKAEG